MFHNTSMGGTVSMVGAVSMVYFSPYYSYRYHKYVLLTLYHVYTETCQQKIIIAYDYLPQ